MIRPEYQISELGICLPVRHCAKIMHDADTPAVEVDGGIWYISYVPSAVRGSMRSVRAKFSAGLFQWRVRLIGIDCPEAGSEPGEAATAFARRHLSHSDLAAWVPAQQDGELVSNPLRLASFSRVKGHIFCGESDLAELLRKAGHIKNG